MADEIKQGVWQWDEHPILAAHIFGPRHPDLDKWIHAAYRETSCGSLYAYDPLWGRVGRDRPAPAAITLAQALSDSHWDVSNSWHMAAASALYQPDRGIPSPIEKRPYSDCVEDILGLSGGYLIWAFQLEIIWHLMNLPEDCLEPFRKGINMRSADAWREAEGHKLPDGNSLLSLLQDRLLTGIKKHPHKSFLRTIHANHRLA